MAKIAPANRNITRIETNLPEGRKQVKGSEVVSIAVTCASIGFSLIASTVVKLKLWKPVVPCAIR